MRPKAAGRGLTTRYSLCRQQLEDTITDDRHARATPTRGTPRRQRKTRRQTSAADGPGAPPRARCSTRRAVAASCRSTVGATIRWPSTRAAERLRKSAGGRVSSIAEVAFFQHGASGRLGPTTARCGASAARMTLAARFTRTGRLRAPSSRSPSCSRRPTARGGARRPRPRDLADDATHRALGARARQRVPPRGEREAVRATAPSKNLAPSCGGAGAPPARAAPRARSDVVQGRRARCREARPIAQRSARCSPAQRVRRPLDERASVVGDAPPPLDGLRAAMLEPTTSHECRPLDCASKHAAGAAVAAVDADGLVPPCVHQAGARLRRGTRTSSRTRRLAAAAEHLRATQRRGRSRPNGRTGCVVNSAATRRATTNGGHCGARGGDLIEPTRRDGVLDAAAARRHGVFRPTLLMAQTIDLWATRRPNERRILCCAGCAATHVNFSADGNMQLVAGMTRHLHDV